MKKQVTTDGVAIGANKNSPAIRVGNTIYLSGQTGRNPETGKYDDCVRCQSKRIFAKCKALLEAEGFTLDDVVRCTCYLADINDFTAFNEIYFSFFNAPCPARTCFQVAALPGGAAVEIEMIAAKD